MCKKNHVLSIFIIIIFSVSFSAFADTRKENIELYLVFDKSKSMVEEIRDVTSYISDTFIRDFLIPGDRLVLLQFYGKADLIYKGIITESGKLDIIQDLSKIPADGRFTDIGNALDRLGKEISGGNASSRKYLILLTDGKQEAPPESPYYSPDGSFNHAFLENTKIIQKAGWKIIILGIGNDTVVDELSEELGTTHSTLDFSKGQPEPISSSEILGRIVSSNFLLEGSAINLHLLSEGYENIRDIVIEDILYQLPGGNFSLMDKPQTFTVSPDSEVDISIPLSVDLLKKIKNDGSTGTLMFKFAGDTPFLPAVFDVVINASEYVDIPEKTDNLNSGDRDNKMNNGINWFIIILIIIAAALIVAVIIIRNIISHKDEDEHNGKTKHEVSGDS